MTKTQEELLKSVTFVLIEVLATMKGKIINVAVDGTQITSGMVAIDLKRKLMSMEKERERIDFRF